MNSIFFLEECQITNQQPNIISLYSFNMQSDPKVKGKQSQNRQTHPNSLTEFLFNLE